MTADYNSDLRDNKTINKRNEEMLQSSATFFGTSLHFLNREEEFSKNPPIHHHKVDFAA